MWLNPAAFRMRDVSGQGFVVDGEWYPINPAWRLHPSWLELVETWAACGGLEPRALPLAGGVLDQPAWWAMAAAVIAGAVRAQRG